MTIFVTGGAGFIGGNFVLDWLARFAEPVVNLDKLTYAGNLHTLDAVRANPAHTFVHGDICNRGLVRQILERYRPRAILNFAAESHVDNSIDRPGLLIQSNIVGTFTLLDATREYWERLDPAARAAFRFLHISTDEVYGSLEPSAMPFTEQNPYLPNNPYSASKAASDHLVRAWNHTYGLPVLTTNCCNNYGPYHYPEKLVPLIIQNALAGKFLPVYGDGQQIRDWIYVKDHCGALRCVLERGVPGESYNVGGDSQMRNLELIGRICSILDECKPRVDGKSYWSLVNHVRDRPGHDRRYAINASKIKNELGWNPVETLESGLRKTVEWYLANQAWICTALQGSDPAANARLGDA